MKITILLCIVVLLAGVMLTPSDDEVFGIGPVITRATVSEAPRSFEQDDGSMLVLDHRVFISGSGFEGINHQTVVRFLDELGGTTDAQVVILHDGNHIEAWPPAGTRGRLTLVVENPDRRQASASIEF
jgi:hypothetical protein